MINDEAINSLSSLFTSFSEKKEAMGEVEFTELIKGQYTYLMEIIERFQKDYFSMAEQLGKMNQEIIMLNTHLKESFQLQCKEQNCLNRN